MKTVGERLFRGAVWLTLTRLGVNSLGLISTIILARLLSPGDFGIVAIASAILAIALSVTDLSLGSALIQRETIEEQHFHGAWTISLGRAVLVFVAIALSAYPLARFYGEPRLTLVLVATAVSAALPGLGSPKTALLTRNLVFWQEFTVELVQRLLVFVGTVVSAVFLKSYWALVIGNLLGAASMVAVSYVIAPYRPRFSLTKCGEMLNYSVWLSLGNIVNTLNWRFDQLVLGYLVGKGPLGIYTVADNLAGLPVREATAPLTRTLFPAFSRIAREPERLRLGYARAHGLACAIAIPIGVGFAIVADLVVRVFLGDKWGAAVPIIQILSVTFALQILNAGLQPLAMATGATKLLFGRDLRTFAIRIPFIIAGFLLGGLLGVVIGRAISSFIGTVWNMALVKRLSAIPVIEQFLICWRTFVSAVAMLAGVLALRMLTEQAFPALPDAGVLIMAATAGGLIYCGSSVGLWLAAGKPGGPEAELFALGARLWARRG